MNSKLLARRAAMEDLIAPVEIDRHDLTVAHEHEVYATGDDLLDVDLHGDELEYMQEVEERMFASEVNAARLRSSGHKIRNKDYE